MKKNERHQPVMVREVIENLAINKGAVYIDATLGTGGHAEEIIKSGAFVLGIEMDPEILEVARGRLEELGDNFKLVQGNFNDIDKIAKKNGFVEVPGILFDLGVTNIHLLSASRGFSFGNPEAQLDMRLDAKIQGVKANDLLNVLRGDQLETMFEVTMEPGSARWITKKVLTRRKFSPIDTVGDFGEVCRGLRGKPGLNSATLPFLALRIAVNSELENLKEALGPAYKLLGKRGRLVVISFHSGEDAIVKNFFRASGGNVLTDRPLYPSQAEIVRNPRARSGRMRVLEKI